MQPLTILITTLLCFSTTYTSSTAISSYRYGNNPNATDFIRINCEATLYPTLCFESLVRYASTVQREPARLARVAIGVSLARAKLTARYMANLTRLTDHGRMDPRSASIVRDCFSVVSDAVDQMRASLRQMRRLTVGEQLRFELGNVQTWMSAAITNEDTCTDGFEDYDDDDDRVVKAEVVNRIMKVKEVTSNALALVNGFAAKIIIP